MSQNECASCGRDLEEDTACPSDDCPSHVKAEKIQASQRISYAAKVFGLMFSIGVEPVIFYFAKQLCGEYTGGLWEFYKIFSPQGDLGFFMAPSDAEQKYTVSSLNGYEGDMSAEAFGITVCLYAYSHISGSTGKVGETCAEQYHVLREYMFNHPEARAILKAID